MVRIGDIHKDHYGKHFMTDLHGDSNMGREQVMDKRRGPFRSEKGPSRIMSRSAGVTIRKRRMQLEITVGKKVTSSEMDLLFGKLESHRMSIAGVVVYLVHRGSRKNFGTMDLDLLRACSRSWAGRSRSVSCWSTHTWGARCITGIYTAHGTRVPTATKTSIHTKLKSNAPFRNGKHDRSGCVHRHRLP